MWVRSWCRCDGWVGPSSRGFFLLAGVVVDVVAGGRVVGCAARYARAATSACSADPCGIEQSAFVVVLRLVVPAPARPSSVVATGTCMRSKRRAHDLAEHWCGGKVAVLRVCVVEHDDRGEARCSRRCEAGERREVAARGRSGRQHRASGPCPSSRRPRSPEPRRSNRCRRAPRSRRLLRIVGRRRARHDARARVHWRVVAHAVGRHGRAHDARPHRRTTRARSWRRRRALASASRGRCSRSRSRSRLTRRRRSAR